MVKAWAELVNRRLADISRVERANALTLRNIYASVSERIEGPAPWPRWRRQGRAGGGGRYGQRVSRVREKDQLSRVRNVSPKQQKVRSSGVGCWADSGGAEAADRIGSEKGHVQPSLLREVDR